MAPADADRSPSTSPATRIQAASVLIVIVNYRTAGLTVDCLASLEPELRDWPQASVVVTDNDSGDDSVRLLETTIHDRGWGRWAQVRPLGRNGGFAFGNNGAIAPALASGAPPDYVWLLNPDTVVRPGALRELVAFLDAHPEAGLAGSRLEDPDGTRQVSSFRFPSILGELDHGSRFGPFRRFVARWAGHPSVGDDSQAVDWVAGASLLVRRAVFEDVGLLDDGFFMYFEEVDFCRRALQGGWSCWYVPASRVVHLVGQASGVTDRTQTLKRVPGYWFEARRRYFLRNHGRFRTLIADVAWSAGALSFFARNLIQRKPSDMPDRFFQDFLRHNFVPTRSR